MGNLLKAFHLKDDFFGKYEKLVVEQVIITCEVFLNKTNLVNQSQNTQVQENRYSHLSSVSCLKDLTFTERILAN